MPSPGWSQLMDTATPPRTRCPGPVLVMIGEHDEIVPPERQIAMVERLTATPCVQVVYPDGWHLLLRDLQRQVVWQDILAWIEGAPLPVGTRRAPATADPIRSWRTRPQDGPMSAPDLPARLWHGGRCSGGAAPRRPSSRLDDLGHHLGGIVVLRREHLRDAACQQLRSRPRAG